MTILASFLGVVLAYLIGSLPFAYIFARWRKGVDVRTVGSRNAGALNVWRSVGPGSGLAVLLVDVGKGLLAVNVPSFLGAGHTTIMLAGAAAVAGHIWPVWLGWRGGKGAATVFGVSLGLIPFFALVALLPTLIVVIVGRNVIAGVAGGFILLNILVILGDRSVAMIALCLGLTLLITAVHVRVAWPEYVAALRTRRWQRLLDIE